MPFISVIDYDTLPACLRNLPESHKQQLNDTLLNDQESSDLEMVAFWVSDCDIPREAAEEAIKFRGQIMTTMFLHLFEPV